MNGEKRMNKLWKLIIWVALVVSVLFGQVGRFASASMYADIKAHQVGDLITVLIVETSNASRESKVNSSSKAEMGVDGSVTGSLTNFLPLFGASSTTKNAIDGAEGTEQKDKLTGKISATIMEETENGMFHIQGKRVVSVNGEKNTIEIDGFIRDRDISTDNTIFSYNVANADIVYRKGSTVEKFIKPHKVQKWITWAVGLGLAGWAFIGAAS